MSCQAVVEEITARVRKQAGAVFQLLSMAMAGTPYMLGVDHDTPMQNAEWQPSTFLPCRHKPLSETAKLARAVEAVSTTPATWIT
jgi:hypothetical protein